MKHLLLTTLFSTITAMANHYGTTYSFNQSLAPDDGKGTATLLPGFYEESVFGVTKTVLNATGGIEVPTHTIACESFTITLVAKIKELSGYRKILGFAGTEVDGGVYNINEEVTIYPYGVTGGRLAPNDYFHMQLSKDEKSNRLTLYVNGEEVASLEDSQNIANLLRTITLFKDDEVTSGKEQAPAWISLLRIEEGSVTREKARSAFNSLVHAK